MMRSKGGSPLSPTVLANAPAPGRPTTVRGPASPKGWCTTPQIGLPRYARPRSTVTPGWFPYRNSFVPSRGSTQAWRSLHSACRTS